MNFLRHPAWLWLEKNDKTKIPPVDPITQAIYDTGHEFEQYAEVQFPGGVTLGFSNYDEYKLLPERTRQAIKLGEKVLFQPRFEWREFTCISDVVVFSDNDKTDLYEIKSSTSVKPTHLYDLAFQVAVLEGNGLSVDKVSVIYVNNQYVREGEVEPEKLTTFEDVTTEVRQLVPDTINKYMPMSLSVAKSPNMPDPDPSLAKLGSKSEWLKIYNNLFPTNPKAWPDDVQPQVDQREIKHFLDNLVYPLYFLDYETMMNLIPQFDGHRPYQQIPVQYSLHIIRQPGGELEHVEFLHEETTNPIEPFAERLVGDLGQEGSVIVWNQAFEKTRNDELGRMLPQYRDDLAKINNRVVDLMIPFKSKWYDDPRFEGSSSIKRVLPVLCPELSYKELDIQDGPTAQLLWSQAVLSDKSPDDKQKILDDLKKYCQLDTLAMVEIWRVLGRFG